LFGGQQKNSKKHQAEYAQAEGKSAAGYRVLKPAFSATPCKSGKFCWNPTIISTAFVEQ